MVKAGGLSGFTFGQKAFVRARALVTLTVKNCPHLGTSVAIVLQCRSFAVPSTAPSEANLAGSCTAAGSETAEPERRLLQQHLMRRCAILFSMTAFAFEGLCHVLVSRQCQLAWVLFGNAGFMCRSGLVDLPRCSCMLSRALPAIGVLWHTSKHSAQQLNVIQHVLQAGDSCWLKEPLGPPIWNGYAVYVTGFLVSRTITGGMLQRESLT